MQAIYQQLQQFNPYDAAEAEAKKIILYEIEQQGAKLLDRNNEAHITSSAFIVNKTRDKVLMVHHNLRDTWSWPGGHADGMADAEANARKECLEETGVWELELVGSGMAGLDIFHVPAHMKKGKQVDAHRHLSIAYIYEADESVSLKVCPDENSQVQWLEVSRIREPLFSHTDVKIYHKLLAKCAK